MYYHKSFLRAMLAVFLFLPLTAYSERADAVKTADTKSQQKVSLPATRQIVDATTFSPVVAEFLQQPLAAQLAMINPSGSPQMTIMWFKLEDGALLFTTTTDRVKFRNFQKDPRATVAIMDPNNMYKWVVVHGKMSVDKRDPAAFYRGLAEHYLEAKSLVEWQKTALMENRTVLRLTPTQIRTMGFP